MTNEQKSLEIGVHALDIDVAITKDNIVVGSHDPYLNKDFTRDLQNDSQWLKNNNIKINKLNFSELKRYDVGKIDPNSDYGYKYPDQKSLDGEFIPSVSQVIDLIKEYNKKTKIQIEIKTRPDRDSSKFVKNFVDHIILVLRQQNYLEYAELQSFDWRVLQYAKQVEPKIKTSYITKKYNFWERLYHLVFGAPDWKAGHLLTNYKNSIPYMITRLGGDIWCPNYKGLSEEYVKEAHAYNLKVIPWTVNDEVEMLSLIKMGVDGIITDRPDILKKII